MAFLLQLKWRVPQSEWERYEEFITDEWSDTKLYAGIYAGSAMKEYMDIDGFADVETEVRQDLQTGDPPHTQKKSMSETPLSEQKKCKVQVGVHPPTKEAFAAYARSHGENPGVMFAYAIREYRQGGRLGRIEDARTAGSELGHLKEQEQEQEIPYHVEDKKDYICERVEPDPNGTIRGGDLRELIGDVAGGSRVDDYLPDVLDRLDYVHHPQVYGLYIPRDDLADYNLTEDDPAIDRKPYEALTRAEKIEGIEETLRHPDGSMTVGRVHNAIFNGNGSTSHIRDLVHTVAESDGFAYKSTPSGQKVLRAVGTAVQESAERLQATDGGSDARGGGE